MAGRFDWLSSCKGCRVLVRGRGEGWLGKLSTGCGVGLVVHLNVLVWLHGAANRYAETISRLCSRQWLKLLASVLGNF